jgi:cobalamin biosynthesis Mg chelatase CobN
MKMAFLFVVLFALCAASVGLIYIAAYTSDTPTTDVYARPNTVQSNLTKGNMSATFPAGISIMGVIAIIVALIIVVVAVLMVWGAMGHKNTSTRW